MIRRRFLAALSALLMAALFLPAAALAQDDEGYSISAERGVYVCTYQSMEEAEQFGNIMYPELTDPGERQRYLRAEYDVPVEMVGGEDTFRNGLAPSWSWTSPDVAEIDGMLITSSDSVLSSPTGGYFTAVTIMMVPISQQPVERAVITATGTDAEGRVTNFDIDLVYAAGAGGRDIAVSGGSGVGMQLIESPWLDSLYQSDPAALAASATRLSADDPACAELVASIDDGEVVGVFDFSLTVGPSQSSEGFGTAWVTFPVDEKYDGSFVDVWTWRAETASYVSDRRHAVLRGTYPVFGGKVTVPFSSLTQVALSVQTQGSTMSMCRLYNPNSGEHFYTLSTAERDVLTSVGWVYEGTGWTAPASSGTPVYRLYNPNAGDHHYTTDSSECDMLASVGWTYEGIGWYSDDAQSKPVYRQYNPNAVTGSHNFTPDASERDMLVAAGWHDEGIGWWGV